MNDENICILGGGWSNEREISLRSSKAVYDCLIKHNHSAFYYDMSTDSPEELNSFIRENNISSVFNLIHGIGGEDGKIQKYLDQYNIKYHGSDSKSSLLSFDKQKTKDIWTKNGLITPSYEIYTNQEFEYCHRKYNLPFFIKDVCSGSSNNIFLIKNTSDFSHFLSNHDPKLKYIIEKRVVSKEYTAAILKGSVLPLIHIEPSNEFYDFDAKYNSNKTKFIFPHIDTRLKTSIDQVLLKAFDCLGCQTWGRIDFFINKEEIILLEINTIPGMTDHSLVPKAASKIGMSYYDLILKIIS